MHDMHDDVSNQSQTLLSAGISDWWSAYRFSSKSGPDFQFSRFSFALPLSIVLSLFLSSTYLALNVVQRRLFRSGSTLDLEQSFDNDYDSPL